MGQNVQPLSVRTQGDIAETAPSHVHADANWHMPMMSDASGRNAIAAIPGMSNLAVKILCLGKKFDVVKEVRNAIVGAGGRLRAAQIVAHAKK